MSSSVSFEEIAEVIMGQSPSAADVNRENDGVPLLNGPTEFGSHHPKPVQFTTAPNRLAEAGDILFCVRGSTTGRMNWADQQYSIGRGIAAIRHRTNPELNPFIKGVIDLNLDLILQSATGSTFPNVTAKQLYSLKIVPDLNQDFIAKFLGDLDRKIELNRRMNETLEQIGQALFKKYFVDNPERESWDNRTLGEFFPIRTGKKDANFSTADGQYPFFTCSQNILKAPDFSFDGPALLLAGNGDFNIKYYRGKFEAYQRTYVLIPHNEKILGLLYFLMSLYLNEITGGSRGSVIKFITKGMIEDYIVRLPDDDQLAEVSGHFNQLTIAIEKNKAQMKTLATIRDSLLPKLMDGSIEL